MRVRALPFFLAAASALAQPSPKSINLALPSPPPVSAGTAAVVGAPGFYTYYYWVVARYTRGAALPASPFAAVNANQTLTGSDYVRVSWSNPGPQAASITYDVLRTATAVFPSGSCTCAVAISLSTRTVNDQGAALSSYTVPAAATPSTLEIFLNGTDYAAGSAGRITVDGVEAALVPMSGLTTPGAVVYVVSASQMGQDPSNFFWDSLNHRLGVGNAAPGYPVDVTGTINASGGFRVNGNIFSDASRNMLVASIYDTALTNQLITFGSADVNIRSGIAFNAGGASTFYNATPSTGVTSVTVKAGAGQGTNTLGKFQDNSGNTLRGVDQGGLDIVAVASIASAGTIAPVRPVTHITGTTTISTITVPVNFAASGLGGCLTLIPDGLWATNTAGNIALATAAAVSKILTVCYDNATSKWYPSY